jgi:hypothetical protein
MGQGFTLIYRFKPAWIDEFVVKPRKSCRIEGFRGPRDDGPSLPDMAAIGMKEQPNIEWPPLLDLWR